MTPFQEWVKKWGLFLPPEALQEFYAVMLNGGDLPDAGSDADNESRLEAEVLNEIRRAAPHYGVRLWRNNVGAAKTETGSFIRFGLANDSKLMNTNIKSADLIGIETVVIKPSDVGQCFGRFLSIEGKRPGWVYNPESTGRELAQMRWAQLVNAMGGRAMMTSTSEGIFK